MPEGTIVRGSWWLGRSALGWPTARSSMITGGPTLELRAVAGGPRSLRAPSGTLGELVLPTSLAVDDDRIWLLDRRQVRLRRFEPLTGQFVDVFGFGGTSTGAHRFGRDAAISATHGSLAMADPERTDVVVVAADPLIVRRVLDLGDRHPLSVTGCDGRFFVLDDGGRVFRSTRSMDRLERVDLRRASPTPRWTRIIVDSDGRLCLIDEDLTTVHVFAADARWVALASSAEEIRAQFDRLPVAVDWMGRFIVPARFGVSHPGDNRWFDRWGDPTMIPVDETPGPARYETAGTWMSEPLDSGKVGCRWHRIVATMRLPTGCTVELSTYASDEARAPDDLVPGVWSRPHARSGESQPVDPGDPAVEFDVAVLNGVGRYLWVRIELRGDGWSTPSITDLLVEPDRPGLERFLPAIYRSDAESEDFMHRFLSIFGAELDKVEQHLRILPARFSPEAVPEPWLDSLARELGVPLERTWEAAARRRVLAAAPRRHPRRGTPAAIRSALRVHLEAAYGRPIPDSVPVLIEGFRERRVATLGRDQLPFGDRVAMWSDRIVDRPRLGTAAYRSRFRLVSVGDHETDRFRHYANGFTVVVPWPFVPDRTSMEQFERLVDAEKPAHVAHEVVAIEPCTVVGEQCRLDVDTYVGAPRVVRLASEWADRTVGPRLGAGAVLGRRDVLGRRAPAVGRGARVDMGMALI